MSKIGNKGIPLVMVEWEDSARPLPEWQHLGDLQINGPVQCASVGWLLEDGEKKVLAPNMGNIEDEHSIQACGVIQIPSRAVIRIVTLEETA